jgi:hypothetical protein
MSAAESILSTVVAFPRFTVADLVSACDLPAQTIRSVLRRNEDWFEEVGHTETGRPGGRWKEYRATAAARAELAHCEDSQASARVVPSELTAVEELLLAPGVGDLPRTTVESLLRRARRFREEAGSAVSRDEPARLHVRVADALIALTEAELSGDRAAWRRLRVGIGEWRSLATAADAGLMVTLEERFERSRLGGSWETSVVTGTETCGVAWAASKVLAELVDLLSSLVSSEMPALQAVVAPASRASRPTGADIAARARRRVVYLRPTELPGFAGTTSRMALGARGGAAPVFLGTRHAAHDASAQWSMRPPAAGLEPAQDNQLFAWQSAAWDVDRRGLGWP